MIFVHYIMSELEQHPVVIAYHAIDTSSSDLSDEQREVIANAYALRDVYHGESLNNLIESYHVSIRDKVRSCARDISKAH